MWAFTKLYNLGSSCSLGISTKMIRLISSAVGYLLYECRKISNWACGKPRFWNSIVYISINKAKLNIQLIVLLLKDQWIIFILYWKKMWHTCNHFSQNMFLCQVFQNFFKFDSEYSWHYIWPVRCFQIHRLQQHFNFWLAEITCKSNKQI